MGLFSKKLEDKDENRKLIIPLYVVLEREGSVDATVTGPFWYPREAINQKEWCGERANIVQTTGNKRAARKGRPAPEYNDRK